ncbi:DUF5825 family protein [Rummeliibacillus pycnus]|uniref:DUF5825 family protein n=1 Tax=Rummeliibacillus pycnus TaxID=101070 RepID=UPI0037C8CECA
MIDTINYISNESIAAASCFGDKAQTIKLEYAKLNVFLSKLKNINSDKKQLGLEIEIIRQANDNLNGEFITELKEFGVEKIYTTLELNEKKCKQTLKELHFLKKCQENYIVLQWEQNSKHVIDFSPLFHFQPPYLSENEDENLVITWKNNYALESLIYRQGPEYIKIRDARIQNEPQIYELITNLEVKLFNCTKEFQKLDELISEYTEELVILFIDLGILVCVDNMVFNIVQHINEKSIPYTTI